MDTWADAKSSAARWNQHVGAGPEAGPLAEEAMKLNIPKIAQHPTNQRGSTIWTLQTYKDFATEAERKNSGVSFSKNLMDTAFRISLTRLPKQISGSYSRDKQAMVDRVSSRGDETSRIPLTAGNSVLARNLIGIGKMPRDRRLCVWALQMASLVPSPASRR